MLIYNFSVCDFDNVINIVGVLVRNRNKLFILENRNSRGLYKIEGYYFFIEGKV